MKIVFQFTCPVSVPPLKHKSKRNIVKHLFLIAKVVFIKKNVFFSNICAKMTLQTNYCQIIAHNICLGIVVECHCLYLKPIEIS